MSLGILMAYLALQLAIGFYISKKIQTESDYLVAGRNLPMWMVALSLYATWFGAETCIGSSAEVYSHGLSGSRADPLGYSLCLFLTGLLLAKKVWNKKYLTLADFYKDRYGQKTEKLALWILAISSLIWGAAQLRAFGQVVAATTDMPVDLTTLLSFLFVVSYCLLGGLLGDMVTDVVQGLIVGAGLFLMLFFVVSDVPDMGLLLSTQTSERWSLLAPNESLLERIDRWMIPVLGSLVAQEIIARILSARSGAVAQRASYLSGFIYLVVGSVPIFLGFIGPELLNVGDNPEQFLIELSKKYLPAFAVPIFAGALISALLATIDSILLGVSSLVGHNFLIPTLKIRGEKNKLFVSRAMVLFAGSIAYALTLWTDSIYELLEAASSFGTAGILVITLFGFWSKIGTGKAALGALIVGLIATPISEYVLELDAPFLTAIGASLITFVGLSFSEKPPQEPIKPALNHELV